MRNNSYLLDKDFLRQVDSYYQREVYAKVVSLDFDENPIAEITGNVTQGTINVNGDSAVRRTCNLTLVTSSVQVNEIDWSLRTKFRLYIGLKNYVDPDKYDDILWFKQGTFIITSFSSTLNQSGYTISLQGKDKMCLLNGDIGGNLFSAHDFGKLYTLNEDDTTTIDDIPIYEIIREALHVYALEPYSNIIINDLEDCAVELLDFNAKNAVLYIIEDVETNTPNMYFSNSLLGKFIEYYNSENPDAVITDDSVFTYPENSNSKWHLIKRAEYGETIGYRLTNLTYVGDLIVQVGGTLTSMLDKIVKMLGEFEYFYDIDGRFIFQRKRIYHNVPWTGVVTTEDEKYYADRTNANTSASTYEFHKGLIVESFQNKPQVNNIKNDYAVWGKMPGVQAEIPIHLRYAIDHKPTHYYSYSDEKVYIATEAGGPYDWRELIYQMAKDNNIYRGKIENMREKADSNITASVETQIQFLTQLKDLDWDDASAVKDFNERWGEDYEGLEDTGRTMAIIISELNELKKFQNNEYKSELYYLATWNTGYDAYYADMLSFWREIYNCDGVKVTVGADGMRQESLSVADWNKFKRMRYWNPAFFEQDLQGRICFKAPHKLPFWIEFIDDNSELGKYSVSEIGRRPKVINDADVKAIFFRDTPTVLFIDSEIEESQRETSLSYVRFNLPPAFSNYFTMSSQGKSAKETLDGLVYQHTYFQESITMSVIPIYYLEPNTRISVEDDTSGILGEYLIKSYSLSLAHDGMMSITATKAESRIL